MSNILVINGPNLNLLGLREPGLYGKNSLKDIEQRLSDIGKELKVNLEFYQSNHEGSIVDTIQNAQRQGGRGDRRIRRGRL